MGRVADITKAIKAAGIEVVSTDETGYASYDADIALGGACSHISVSVGYDMVDGPYALLTIDTDDKVLVSEHTDETIVAAILAA
jgi:hypothetical protein